ncbi:MAG: AMP-binding protein [Bdellovibrio sp.]|nr:AMP-binding protein [Bdellovibrio sp.]
MFDFSEGAYNQLLINPRLSDEEKNIFLELHEAFADQFGVKNYFLVPSSGSSKKMNESVKLIALHRDAVLNSAKRFNDYFRASAEHHWGLVLPSFHVAGLGTYARAYLAGSQVFENTWSDSQIKFLSIVPAQLYDFVNQNQNAPKNLQTVLVGAGVLNAEIKGKAVSLGWPLVETYGMSETASMIAVKEKNILHTLPNVEVQTENQQLKIKCNSLLTCYLQKKDSQIFITQPVQGGWYQTEDQAAVNGDQINLLGRSSDYIKILGEGVSLAELKDRLAALSIKHQISHGAVALLDMEDPRSGHQLILAVENSVNSEIIKRLLAEFNQSSRPYEKIKKTIRLEKIPLSDLGKIRTQELKEIVLKKLKAESS